MIILSYVIIEHIYLDLLLFSYYNWIIFPYKHIGSAEN